jgi:UDP-2,3-diacylglucosamine pyrophosphatase LpxH
MRFLRENKANKSVIIISDIHLGAGYTVNGKRNYLEDFHYDKELVDFLNYHCTGDYANREVELIINGDLFDLLAVPFVPFFDDEFWSEEASLQKLKIILDAHPEVMEAMRKFVSIKKKKIVYIIGNHDAELIFDSLRDLVLNSFPEKDRDNFLIKKNESGAYEPLSNVVIKHGHEYEIAHNFDAEESIIEDEDGKKYFLPPWGSYYVTRVVNKYKEERDHINAVRPIKKFIINSLIYDTFFILRFCFATTFYFIMVRTISVLKEKRSFRKMIINCLNELELFQDYETLTQEYFQENPNVKALIVGHTHDPIIRSNSTGSTFINTGTWTNMYHLDFGKRNEGDLLTYAQIDVQDEEKEEYDVALNVWKGTGHLPYSEFS